MLRWPEIVPSALYFHFLEVRRDSRPMLASFRRALTNTERRACMLVARHPVLDGQAGAQSRLDSSAPFRSAWLKPLSGNRAVSSDLARSPDGAAPRSSCLQKSVALRCVWMGTTSALRR